MIDYKEAKKYLLPTLLDYGFKERKDKSCKSCLVFSDGSETLLVYRNQRGIYDHYVNKSASDDYGDAVHFIMKRVLNKTTNLSAEDFCKVEAELSRIAGLGVIKDVINNTSTIQEKQPFDISKYTVERLDLAAVPGACRRFFEQRHIDPRQLAPFKSVIGILVSDRGFKQPLFYWQNMDGNIVGAQYKYIKDNKTEVVIARNEHFTEERLVQCKYFEVYKYDVNDEAKITVDEASFVSVLFINGSGTIETDDYEKTMEFKAGDSFFVSAGLRSIIIKGQATMVVTRV